MAESSPSLLSSDNKSALAQATPPPPTILEPSRLLAFGEKMRQLSAELTDIFPEREHLIKQIVYALLTREHVLVHGVFGTGKTDLVNGVFGAFDGPTVFSIALTKFMSESHVIGIPDPKEMREEGVLHYQREGGILDAHFAELDEIFDANAPLLRVLLGILNERQFKRGRQCERAELHMAIASTNGDPETVVKNAPELGAVIDRFIFCSKVEYLQQDASRKKMYRKFVEDRRPASRIDYADLVAVSQMVNGTTMAIDDDILGVYDQVIQSYRGAIQKTRQVVSDRRACKLIKLVRASAALHGRAEVDIDDLYAVRWGLCMGNDKAQHDTFDKACKPVIEKAAAAKKQSVDDLCARLLGEYQAQAPSAIPKEAKVEDLVALYRKVNALKKQVEDVKPQLPSTEERKQKLVAQLTTLSSQLNDKLSAQS